MTELLFIAITIFFIYVVFQVVGKQEEPESAQEQSTPAEPAEAVKPQAEAVAPAPAAKAAKPASKRTPKSSSPAKSKAAATAEVAAAPAVAETVASAGDSIKNPKTGEVAKVSGNYAFAKRWIKDALVEEGLLDKVYKNNELDAEATAKIQEAMQKLKAMAKYQ